jgi:AcrR family transcriptional regulator
VRTPAHDGNGHAACRTCRQLGDALIELIAEHGYSAITAARVCARAGMSPDALTGHAGDLDGLLVTAFQQGVDDLYGRAEDAFASPGPWDRRFRRAVEAIVLLLADRPGLGRLCFVDAVERGGPEIWRRRDRAFRRFVELVAKSDEDDGRPRLRFELLVGALHTTLRERVLQPGAWRDLPALCDELAALAPVFEPVAA